MAVWNLKAVYDGKLTGLYSFTSTLYSFTSTTFTPGAATGRNGPTLAQAIAGLSGTSIDNWKTNTLFFNVSNGFQLWTCPGSGLYNITIAGAKGGDGTGGLGGLGSVFTVQRNLVGGTVYTLIIGQSGTSGSIAGYTGGGGGGGTFFYQDTTCLIAAGGGGGTGSKTGGGQPGQAYNLSDGSAGLPVDGSYPGAAGGTGGAGGNRPASNGGAAGAGILSRGQDSGSYNGYAGETYSGGFLGGLFRNWSGTATGDGSGGFGGGAGVGFHSGFEINTGGGGGYSGGGGSGHFNAGSGQNSGGGGGSYIGSSTYVSTSSGNNGPGYITITKL